MYESFLDACDFSSRSQDDFEQAGNTPWFSPPSWPTASSPPRSRRHDPAGRRRRERPEPTPHGAEGTCRPPASRRHRRVGSFAAPAGHVIFRLIHCLPPPFEERRLRGARAERGGWPGPRWRSAGNGAGRPARRLAWRANAMIACEIRPGMEPEGRRGVDSARRKHGMSLRRAEDGRHEVTWPP